MNATSQRFSLAAVPEVFFTRTRWSREIRSLTKAGTLRTLGPRLYTKNLSDDARNLVRRNLWQIVGGYFAGAVVSDRTAIELRPADDVNVFITHNASDYRTVELPGLVIRARPGPGPLPGDTPYVAGLHISSEARAFLENLRRTRARAGLSRVLSREQLELRLTEIAARRGTGALNELRDAARSVAGAMDAEDEYSQLDEMIAGLFGTTPVKPRTGAGRALRLGQPFDPNRIELFDLLVAEIRAYVRPIRPANDASSHFAFYEAYFSNYIEGTEFLVEEAKAIVFEGRIPSARPQDAHDVIGTFRLVSDPVRRARTASGFEDFRSILLADHATLLAARSEARPGQFKDEPNQAGGVSFVEPEAVDGTLSEGCARLQALSPGFERAVFQLFLVAEVHPFLDGNGRMARARMNAELSAAGEQRAMITTAHRDDYIKALRALSLQKNPTALVRVADHIQAWSAESDWSTDEASIRSLNAIDAFSDVASGGGVGAALGEGDG